MTDTEDVPISADSLWGDYVVPSLAGVRGHIEFIGPRGSAHMLIDDGQVKVTAADGKADCVVTAETTGDLVRLVRGEINVVTAALQGRVDAKGDLILALKVAGSIPELGKQQASASARGGE